MTQKEFFERTGISTNEAAFAEIEDMYMSVGMDKNVFCEEFKEHGQSLLAKELYATINSLRNSLNRKMNELDIKENELNIAKMHKKDEDREMGEWLVNMEQITREAEIRERAISLLTPKGYILYKLENDIPLWESDKKLMKDLLK